MKAILSFVLYLFVSYSFAQNRSSDLEDMRLREAYSAHQQLNFNSNPNTGNYKINYHRLFLEVDPTQEFISGEVTTYYKATVPMQSITFDLAVAQTVSAVMQRGDSLSFMQNSNDELVIDLPFELAIGTVDSLSIRYSGNPVSNLESFEINTHNNQPILWTLSEPFGAKAWWPCKQDLTTKVDSIDVFIKMPELNPNGEINVAVSNGLEQSQTVSNGYKTTHFKHRYPIPAYLIAIAVTNYTVYTDIVDNNGQPFEIVNYVYPEQLASVQSKTAVTIPIMNLFADLFEPYPYADEKYGHAQFGWAGGMEHTTVSFMGSFSRELIAHELAHQWFGNKITCGSWKDIWLNEGFANYLYGLVVEHMDGEDAFSLWRQQLNNSITSKYNGAVYLTDAQAQNVNRIFDKRLTYNKSAMVIHMLRRKLGDPVFFEAIRDYLADPNLAFGFANTADFISLVESSSGLDLQTFFDDWIYSEGYPSFSLEWEQSSSSELLLHLSQSQSHTSVSFFEVDLPVRILGTLGEVQNIVLEHQENDQIFLVPIDFMVESIEIDPEQDLISKNNEVALKTTDYETTGLLSIYPNPIDQTLHLDKAESLDVFAVQIYNALGQLVFESGWQSSLQLANLDSGVFFIQLDTSIGRIAKKLLKN